MLVLTRKKQEQIRIGDSITITVLRVKGKSVRLGIEAPQNQSVLRGELIVESASTPEISSEKRVAALPPRIELQERTKSAPPTRSEPHSRKSVHQRPSLAARTDPRPSRRDDPTIMSQHSPRAEVGSPESSPLPG